MRSINLFVLERILAIPRLPGPCAAVFTDQVTQRGPPPPLPYPLPGHVVIIPPATALVTRIRRDAP